MNGVIDQEHVNGGYVLLARKILDSEIMTGSPLQKWLFIWMLLRANHRNWNNLKRGQLHTSIGEMQEAMSYWVGYRKHKPTRGQIRKSYEGLTKSMMISTTKSTRGMIITIRNYERYQNPKNYEGHSEEHNESSTKVTEGAQDKQEWKNKEKEKINSSEPKGSKPVITFDKEEEEFQGITEELRNRWKQTYRAVDIDLEIRKAEQWAASNPNKQKRNWRRFITNWLSRVQEDGGSKGFGEKTPQEESEPRYIMDNGKPVLLEDYLKGINNESGKNGENKVKPRAD